METDNINPVQENKKSKQFKILITAIILVLLIASVIFFIHSMSKANDSDKNVEEEIGFEDNSLINEQAQILDEEEEIELGELI